MRKIFICLIFVVFITGCGHVISEDVRKTVDPTITTANIFTETDNLKGKIVMLGGKILNTQHEEKGTYIEILEKPLDFRGYPEDSDVSRGRFLAFSESFLDSAIYARGKFVTVVGEIMGVTKGKIERVEYNYPVIKIKEIQIVRLDERGVQPTFHFGIGIFKGF